MKKLGLFAKRFNAGLYLGAGLKEKMRAAFGLVVISRLKIFTFTLSLFGRKQIVIVKTGSDVATLVEVLYDQEYALPDDFNPKTIIDLGANVGFSSLYFSMRNPDVKIVALEPDPNNFKLCVKNLEHNKNIIILPAGISATPGTETFYAMPNQGMSSSLIARPQAQPLPITTYSLESLLNHLMWPVVDLVKFDVEGAEWDTFKDTDLTRTKVFIGEFHEHLTGHTVAEFVALFQGFSSQVKKVHEGRYVILFICLDQKQKTLQRT